MSNLCTHFRRKFFAPRTSVISAATWTLEFIFSWPRRKFFCHKSSKTNNTGKCHPSISSTKPPVRWSTRFYLIYIIKSTCARRPKTTFHRPMSSSVSGPGRLATSTKNPKRFMPSSCLGQFQQFSDCGLAPHSMTSIAEWEPSSLSCDPIHKWWWIVIMSHSTCWCLRASWDTSSQAPKGICFRAMNLMRSLPLPSQLSWSMSIILKVSFDFR